MDGFMDQDQISRYINGQLTKNRRKKRDYYTEQQTTEIFIMLKKYQDVFTRDYKDLNGLV